ncbi:MAG TPA: hypothetical protein VNO79_06335 [Actinomycetota bacterium]|nr:hypothetical protein [Actinomycetota bacterium]
MRRFTAITLIVLGLLLAGAAAYQILLASQDRGPYPGPAPGTPLPPGLVSP